MKTDPNNPEAVRRRSRRQFLLLAGLFLLPAVAATVLYYSGWRDAGTINRGSLVTPVEIRDGAYATPDRREAGLRLRKWTYLVFADGECRHDCAKLLYHIRQARLAQGKDTERVTRLLVVTDGRLGAGLQAALAGHEGLEIRLANETQLAALAAQLQRDPRGLAAGGEVFMIDPRGMYFMFYPPATDPRDLVKDMARLLKVSKIG
jgi:hypothetical protein